MSSEPPSGSLINVLSDSLLGDRITYIQGTAFSYRDLARTAVDQADACFLMANKFASQPANEDAQSILTAMAIKRFVWSCVRAGHGR